MTIETTVHDRFASNSETWPRLSIIIPVLNAAGVVERCLKSIRLQNYPADRLEILVADGGSTDGTRDIVFRYEGFLIENPFRIAEQGKRLALLKATGEFIVFLDADNELSHPDFLSLAVRALQKFPQTIGVESYYPASAGMGTFCGYLTATLHISDPVAWMMSVNPVHVRSDGPVEVWSYPPGSLAYPLGANGFIFRSSDLAALGATEKFEDTAMVLRLAQQHRLEWLRLSGRGVHHYIVDGLLDFLKKRRRQTYHFLSLRDQHTSWTSEHPRMPGWLACIACATMLIPILQMVSRLIKTGDKRWLWHPIACLLSVTGVAWGVFTFMVSNRTADSEAALQPTQKISRQK